MIPAEARAVLNYWLVETPPQKRFARDAALDAVIAARFGDLHARLAAGVPDAWAATPHGLLAAVIVLDQFSRNLFRDDPRAFAHDGAALALTRRALARGDEAALDSIERQFLYLPLMHSEDPADQARSVALFDALGDPQPADFARRHQAVIARFGRFPGRNAALGRATTAAERTWLAEDGGF